MARPRSITLALRRHGVRLLTAASGSLLLGAALASAAQMDNGVHPPPTSGIFGYNNFTPAPIPGASYVDPVFGETVRRVTTDHAHDDLYARNMWWSADGSRYLHRTNDVAGKIDAWDVIDVETGTVTHTGIPFGSFSFDGGFDPVDPDVLYYLVRDRGDGHGAIHRVTLGPAGTWRDSVDFTAPGRLDTLGGTLNWLDASGRYMVVRYGGEPSVHVYDRQNLAAGPYANPVGATHYVDAGAYIGITPDGKYLVGYDDRAVGFARLGQGVSWTLDHTKRAIAAAGTVFWSLCGDHGAFMSASDGHDYMITYDCDSEAGLWRVDVSNNAAGLDEAQQQALPNNRLLLALPTWNDFGHLSTVARGPLQDWAFLATEDGADTFHHGADHGSGDTTPWHAYRQEIIALNATTGEIRRLAHHRSRSVTSDYYSTPRVSASWEGDVVGFASNYDQGGSGAPIVDIYAIPFGATLPERAPTVPAPTAPEPAPDTSFGTGRTSLAAWMRLRAETENCAAAARSATSIHPSRSASPSTGSSALGLAAAGTSSCR